MFTSRTHRRTVICAIVCALLASALTGVARAGVNEQTRAALAQERYYSSYGEPAPTDAATSAALAQERYYSSYGDPEPLTVRSAGAVRRHAVATPRALGRRRAGHPRGQRTHLPPAPHPPSRHPRHHVAASVPASA